MPPLQGVFVVAVEQRTIERGTALCKQLVRKSIDAGSRINWESLVLGGPCGEA